MEPFRKKTYRPLQFLSDLSGLAASLPSLAGLLARRRVSGALREKAMLAVTGVNDCRYCAFVHSNLARKLDVPDNEIERIMDPDADPDCAPEDLEAIGFARHYAQTNQSPDPDRVQGLRDTLGRDRADELILYLRMIYLANLTGNTFDSVLHRLGAGKS